MKKNKLIPIPKLKKLMDKLCSHIVIKRDGCCVMCGKTPNLNAHHAIIRKAQSLWTKWLPRNLITLCWDCHFNYVHGQRADYKWLKEYIYVVEKMIPLPIRSELEILASNKAKIKRADLMGIYDNLQSINS